MSPTGRFFLLQLLRKAWISPNLPLVPEPVPHPGSWGCGSPFSLPTRMYTRGYASLVHALWALHMVKSHECTRSHLTPLSMSSVHWVCPSLTSRRPLVQSYSSPGPTNSCPTCLRVSRRSTAPRRRWRPGRPPGRTWRWWWWGWGRASLACCLLRWSGWSPRSPGIQWSPQLEGRDRSRRGSWDVRYNKRLATRGLYQNTKYVILRLMKRKAPKW